MNIVSKSRKTVRPKVIMLGPNVLRRGGIAAVEQFYLDAWDYQQYDLRHIATAVDGPKYMKLLFFVRACVQFCFCLIFWKPHLIHIHFGWKESFYRKLFFVFIGRLFGFKLVLHCHAGRFDVFYEDSSSLGKRLICAALNSSNVILVVSEQWHEFFKALPLRVPVYVLHNPVVCPLDIPTRTDYKPVVLSLGRLGQRKGTYDLLQVVPRVIADHPEVEFWLAGDGDIKKVRTQLSKEPWGKRVRLLGWVRGKKKEEVLAKASIFVLPSYYEGLPIAILEAMASGLPVVSTSVGGIPEAILDGETGFLVTPGDIDAIAQKVTLLLDNPLLRKQIGATAWKRVSEKFEVGVVIQQLFRVYDSLIQDQLHVRC